MAGLESMFGLNISEVFGMIKDVLQGAQNRKTFEQTVKERFETEYQVDWTREQDNEMQISEKRKG